MFTNSLDNKPIFKKDDGTEIKDLTQTMFDLNDGTYVSYSIFKVSKEYVMRPDLISQAVYGSSQYAEIILKYNGISNPLTIEPDQIISIPNLDSLENKFNNYTITTDAAEKLRKSYKYIDPTKAPTSSPEILNFENREDEFKNAVPPNFAIEGEEAITYRNGRVYFGENVANSACLKNGMPASEFLNTIINSNL